MTFTRVFSMIRAGALVAVLLVISQDCHAQFSANVQGTVTDPKGAVVRGATVTLTNLATNVSGTTTTGSSGSYRFDSILPGDYQVTVEAQGFEKALVKRHVGTDETAGINIRLTLGSASATVEVTTAESGLNPDETRLEYTLTPQDLNNVPLPDRATLTALRLAPGVVGTIETSGSSNTNIPIGQATPDARANGRPASSNVYLLDRIPITSTENTGALNMVPNPDMLAEIALQTTTFAVDNGATSSLQVDFTSKSGTNKYHGDFDFTYTGKPFEANPDFGGVSPFHRKYFLGSFGGPIVKDHTFFFGSVERVENLSALGATATALSDTGIGAFATQNYLTPAAGWNTAGAAYAKLFTYGPGNLTNLTTASTADNYYPNPAYDHGTTKGNAFGVMCNDASSFNLPCGTVVSVTGEFNQNPGITGQQYNLRLDHSFNQDKDRIYVGYFGVQQNSDYIDPRPAFDTKTPSQSYYFSAGYSHTFTPRLLNQFNAGLNRFWGGGVANPDYAIFPHGTFFGFENDNGGFFGGPQQSPDSPYIGADTKEHVFALRDYVSWLKGSHSFKFGFQTAIRNYWQNSSAQYSRPYNTYFSDILEMLQGEADEYSLYTIGASGPSAGKWISQVYGAEQKQFGGYVQDDWKVRPNLLLTVGLRWDDFGNPGEYGQSAVPYSNTFLGTGSDLYSRVSGAYAKLVSQAFTSGQSWNFLPRAAVAWSPAFAHNFVVRGGVGLYQDAINLNQITANLPTTTPVRLTLTLHDAAECEGNFFANIFTPGCSGNPGGFWSLGRWQGTGSTGTSAIAGEPGPFAITGTQGVTPPYGIPYPTIPVTGISSRGLALGPDGVTYQSDMYGVDPKLKPQSTVIWNFGVEQGLPNAIVLGATYSGSYSYDQFLQSAGYNNPPTAIEKGASPWAEVGKVNLIRNVLSSNYNALILTASQRNGNLSWQGSYLWSHALGNPGSGDNPSPYTATAAYGTLPIDVHQRLTFSGAYQLEGGTSALAKGWALGGIFIAQDGTPFTVYSSQDVNGDGNKDVPPGDSGGGNDLPNVVFQPGSGLHYGKYSNAQFKAGIFNQCGGGSSGSGNLYDPVHYPNCPFQTVTTPNSNTLEGNEQYNAFRNPGYWDVDLNLQKKFELPWFADQKAHLNLRFEALNTFNHANLNGFGGNIQIGTTTQFGQVTSAANPRILQVGGRFEF